MAIITIIDDDLAMDCLMENLRYRGHDAKRIGTAREALENIDNIVSSDLIVLDIILPWPLGKVKSEVSGSRTAGMEILKEIRAKNSKIPIIVFSVIQDMELISVFNDDKYTNFIPKWGMSSLNEFVWHINKVLCIEDSPSLPTTFIVHGHNETTKLSLKNYLQNTLNFPEPIILHEQPNQGRTIIEKFEYYAGKSSLVFVLLTPDDIGGEATTPNDLKRRARQNVIFELGYFLGMLGRTGRVLLLHQGPIELPSDLSGVVYIDITNGIEATSEIIRREIKNVR